MEPVVTIFDVSYLPLPNRVEVYLTDQLAPVDICLTAFCVPITLDGRIVISLNQKRGLEISGGHIDPGETAIEAGIRETLEETGCEVEDLQPIGYLKLISNGTVPDDYRYPHPIGYQQYFTGRVVRINDYEPNLECTKPLVIDPCQASSLLIHKPTSSIFIEEALKKMNI